MCWTHNINDNTMIKIKYSGINEMTSISRHSHIVFPVNLSYTKVFIPYKTTTERIGHSPTVFGLRCTLQSMCVYYMTQLHCESVIFEFRRI